MSEIQTTAHSAEERERMLTEIYKNTFSMVAKFVANRGGTFDQAKDIFHDALVIWYEKLVGDNQFIIKSEKAYLFGIAKHLWYKDFEKGTKLIAVDVLPEIEYVTTEEQLSMNKLLDVLEQTGKKCLNLLKSFYYDSFSMKELASGFGFKSVRSATVQKYKCLEKVRETVKEKSMCYEDFLE